MLLHVREVTFVVFRPLSPHLLLLRFASRCLYYPPHPPTHQRGPSNVFVYTHQTRPDAALLQPPTPIVRTDNWPLLAVSRGPMPNSSPEERVEDETTGPEWDVEIDLDEEDGPRDPAAPAESTTVDENVWADGDDLSLDDLSDDVGELLVVLGVAAGSVWVKEREREWVGESESRGGVGWALIVFGVPAGFEPAFLCAIYRVLNLRWRVFLSRACHRPPCCCSPGGRDPRRKQSRCRRA